MEDRPNNDDDIEIEIIDEGDDFINPDDNNDDNNNDDNNDSNNEENIDDETPERKDKIMNILIAVGATFIIMFLTFCILKINSAIKSATILNRTTAVSQEASSEDESEQETTCAESYTTSATIHTTPALNNDNAGNENTDNFTTDNETTDINNYEQTTSEPETLDESGKESAVSSMSLTPVITGYAPLDSEVSKVLSGVSGDSYEKLKSIYTLIIRNISNGTIDVNDENVNSMLGDTQYANTSDAYRIYEAYQTLSTRRGSDSGYASAFMVIAREMGANAYYVTGKSYKTGSSHAWVVVNIRGQEYIFDPYLDDMYKNNGTILYDYFCKTQNEVPGLYLYSDKYGDMNKYGGFKTIEAMTLNVNFNQMTAECKWTPSSDMVPCTYNVSEEIVSDTQNSIEINADVTECEINEWNVVIKDDKTGQEVKNDYKAGGSSSYSYVWIPQKEGNYSITVSAKDSAGRICQVAAQAKIVNGDNNETGTTVKGNR